MSPLAQATDLLISLALEAAAAIGAGAIIGSFVGATAGFVNGWPRKQVESEALRDGHLGAMGVAGMWLFKLCIVYATGIWAI